MNELKRSLSKCKAMGLTQLEERVDNGKSITKVVKLITLDNTKLVQEKINNSRQVLQNGKMQQMKLVQVLHFKSVDNLLKPNVKA